MEKIMSYSVLKRINQISKIFVRYKNPPDHWSVLRKKVHPTDKALQHFDDFYKQVFKKKWPQIREGLLSKPKYVAIVNNYGDSQETMQRFELIGALNMRKLFHLEKEYIREELEKNSRKLKLERIWKMEREMDDSVEQPLVEKGEFDPKQFSLKHSLQDAELDSRRIVDSKNALSTEILNEFVPASKLKGNEDYIPESQHYRFFDTSSKFQVEPEYDIHFPDNLNVYCYEFGNNATFEASKKATTGILNYYLMDGGSILPVLALDLTPNCSFLDLCAAPGGKSLLALQTLYPERVISNDVSQSRVGRIEGVFKQFLWDVEEKWIKSGKITLSCQDGRFMEMENFDRVLVDVPCTTDRHSLKENDNNIFKPSRIKERLQLPELQAEILFNALKLVKKGGIVVYSTCSLSPIQNDGVVGMALKRVWEETKIEVVIKDLTPALLQTRSIFNLAEAKLMKYGHLVLPQKGQNYGPTYFCKIKRIK